MLRLIRNSMCKRISFDALHRWPFSAEVHITHFLRFYESNAVPGEQALPSKRATGIGIVLHTLEMIPPRPSKIMSSSCCRAAVTLLLLPTLLTARAAFAGQSPADERKAALKAAVKETKETGQLDRMSSKNRKHDVQAVKVAGNSLRLKSCFTALIMHNCLLPHRVSF